MSKNGKDNLDFFNMSAEERLSRIERIYIKYPRTDELIEKIDYCRVHSKIAKDPDCLLITGSQGTGKTRLCERYLKGFPQRKVTKRTADGLEKLVLITPVLFVTCPTKATEKGLVEKMLSRLGDTEAGRGTLTSQTIRLCNYIDNCETEEIIIDEFQHFQDRDSNHILKNVANYLKEIIIETRKPMILTGMPYSVAILDDNPQLNRRFKRASLDPLEWKPPQNKKENNSESEFSIFLSMLDDALAPLFIESSHLADGEMALCFYSASGGVIDKVMRLVHMAAALAIKDGLKKMDKEILAEAYDIELSDENENPEHKNPFGQYSMKSQRKPAERVQKSGSTNKRVRASSSREPSAIDLIRRR